MKRRKLLSGISLLVMVILSGMQANASVSCRVFDMKQEDDFQFGQAVLKSPKLQVYIAKKGEIETIWPHSQLCSDSSNLDQVLEITLAFSRTNGGDVPWGWDYCQLKVTLRGTSVIDYRELRCDNAMEDH
jgi:hypothetical protein